ncbi:MAG: helix-turn-helix domain-containing protein [Patescibacteria group bacterium]
MELSDKLYTTEEVAKLVNASRRSIYRYVDEGKLVPETKTAAGTLRFAKKAILEFLYPDKPDKSDVSGKYGSPVLSDLSFSYFKSPISDLKKLAHTIRDKGRSDNKNYAFTLFAGFSLHKECPIKFSTIHIYVNEADLSYWKVLLDLNKAQESEANISLIVDQTITWNQNSYEINQFKVVSDERLKQDLKNYSKETKELADSFDKLLDLSKYPLTTT